jgi:hypothetical protein
MLQLSRRELREASPALPETAYMAMVGLVTLLNCSERVCENQSNT